MSDNGKVYPVTILRPEFVAELQTQARRYAALEKLKSRREWYFGELVNCEWEHLNLEIREEVSKDRFYAECSYWINEASGFPIVTTSGETLRRWCEVAASYQQMPGLDLLREVLSFDHFTKARRLANKGKVSVPAFALAKAVEQGYTAEEMVTHFDPPQAPNEYERVTGWLDGLSTARFEWLDRNRREQLTKLLQEIRKLLEK